jgi:hypothetical protein
MIFLNKNKYLNIYFYIFIISGKWWNALVEYVNPPPAAGAAPPINLEELLRQQVTLLGQIKELLPLDPIRLKINLKVKKKEEVKVKPKEVSNDARKKNLDRKRDSEHHIS